MSITSRQRYPYIVTILVASTCGMYLLMGITGNSGFWRFSVDESVAWGGLDGFLTLSGEWWRLLTYTLVHDGFIHFASNVFFLWILGKPLERHFGSMRLMIIYVLSGLVAGIATILHLPWEVTTGASSAIYGIAGALAVFLLRRILHSNQYDGRTVYLWIGAYIIITHLHYSVAVTPLHNVIAVKSTPNETGHITGFCVGLICAAVNIYCPASAGRLGQSRDVLICACLGLLLFGVFIEMTPNPRALWSEIYKAKRDGDYGHALQSLNALIGFFPDYGDAYQERAYIDLRFNDSEAAIIDSSMCIERQPSRVSALLYRGSANLNLNRLESAQEDFRRALSFAKTDTDRFGALQGLILVFVRLENWQGVLETSNEMEKLKNHSGWAALFRAIASDKVGLDDQAQEAYAVWLDSKTKSTETDMKVFLPEKLWSYLTGLSNKCAPGE